MYALYKDPEGKKVFDKTRPSDSGHNSGSDRKRISESYQVDRKVCISIRATLAMFNQCDIFAGLK